MDRVQILEWCRDLASKVLSADSLDSFLALPLRSQLLGIAVFAHGGGDAAVKSAALHVLAQTPTD